MTGCTDTPRSASLFSVLRASNKINVSHKKQGKLNCVNVKGSISKTNNAEMLKEDAVERSLFIICWGAKGHLRGGRQGEGALLLIVRHGFELKAVLSGSCDQSGNHYCPPICTLPLGSHPPCSRSTNGRYDQQVCMYFI